jgi:aldose sugar dehydrogenase
MAVEINESNRDKCACPGCPTYNEEMAAEEEALYCATGKSVSEADRMGCVCGGCSVFVNYGLAGAYYCLTGETA